MLFLDIMNLIGNFSLLLTKNYALSGKQLSGKRRSRRQRGASGNFGNLQIYRCSVIQVLIGVEFAYVCS